MAEMNVRRGWIDTEFDSQRPAERQFLPQFFLVNDLSGTFA
jgi:hypothetical protein